MDWAGRHVAVTGATGFLGHHLAAGLAARGAAVTALIRSPDKAARLAAIGVRCVVAPLDDPAAMTAAARRSEVFFHLAGAVDFAGGWDRLRSVNEQGTRNALAAASAAGARRFVHTSSIVAVGAARRPVPLAESFAWNLGRLRVPYLTTKYSGEQIALAADGDGLEVVVANPACVIGPDDFVGSEFGTLCKRFWRGRIPVYFGGGLNFVDVRDVADGLLRVAEHGRPGERYILGGENRTLTDFFADLARVAGWAIPRVELPAALGPAAAWLHDHLRPPGTGRPYISADQARLAGWYFFADCSKARRELGYRPRPLAETLSDTYSFWMPRRAA
ncbi:MAG TPA: NAD-dependent epimerase/dehydratase family protein [Gemmataceae bacterium]|jgi:dihydroflavonol-4-reductase